MDKVTELIIVPQYDETQTISITSVVERIRVRLGIFNLIENEFTKRTPVLIFNGVLSKEAHAKCAELAIECGYAMVHFITNKERLLFNNEPLK